ncbi:MAG: AAA family ATPase [Acidobacteria bacterium]|nr:AAA family ATPase [Acidobacteriota bacterium]
MLDTPIARFLAALPNGAQQNGHGWQGRCPAHEDDRASLSISQGDDGRVLLKCHAGCTAASIVAAVGLQMRDLFSAREHHAPEMTFDYRDESGVLLFEVCRFPNKQFRQRRPDGSGGWIWSLGDVRRVIYRLPELAGKEAVATVEGEKDADRLWSIGVPATTNAGGAGKWRDEYSAQLKAAGCKRVAVLPDNDPPGEAHARAVARSCHAAGLSVKIVTLRDLPAKGDVSDYLQTHDKAALLACIRDAAPFDPQQSAAAPIGGTPFELTSLRDLLAEPDDQVEWLVDCRIPTGAVVLVVGAPKAGKSTLVRDLELSVGSGTPFLGWRTAYAPVWHCAFEEKRSEIRKHFRSMGATGHEPIRLFVSQAPTDILPKLRELAERERPGVIVLDPLQRALRVRDLNDYAQTTLAFDPILKLARETGATLILVHHASMHHTRQGIDAILGSTALAGSVDQVFVLARNGQQRALSSTQRIGDDLEPVIIERDSTTGRLRIAGTKRQVDDDQMEQRMLDALGSVSEPVPETWFEAHVEGRNADRVRCLRRLCGMNRVQRCGGGGRKDPYRYKLSLGDSCSRDSGNSPNSEKCREPQSSSSFIDRNLDFGDEVPGFPIRNLGNKNYESPVRTLRGSSYRDTQSVHVPEVPQVPEVPGCSENREIDGSETAETPDRTESDSGSRDFEEGADV